jgi:biotin carboxylase
VRLYLVAGKVTDSVTHGFLPAAAGLGLETILLTDRPDDHRAVSPPGVEIIECDVADYRDIIAHLAAPGAVFSNSDHLQAATALAAAYHGLPAKDWRAALRTKNKALMRRHLASVGLDQVRTADPETGSPPFPCVLKPREGVASEDVFLVNDREELAARLAEIRTRRRDPLVAEEYLPGELRTLETLGDGESLHVLGSFSTALSPPPHFVELRMDWAPPPPETGQVLAQLTALGVGLGACHTEFVVHEGRARLIEVNYRVVGDHADFLLAAILGIPLFEWILRVHLGEAVPTPIPATARHGAVDYVLADRSGLLTAAPGLRHEQYGQTTLTYRPHHTIGDQIRQTHTNRDFLGIIQAVGPSPAAVETALRAFRATHTWDLT